MKLFWTEQAWEDYLHWRRNDPDTLKKINALIADIQRNPFRGLGKPADAVDPAFHRTYICT